MESPVSTNGPKPFFSHHFMSTTLSVNKHPPIMNKSFTCKRFDLLFDLFNIKLLHKLCQIKDEQVTFDFLVFVAHRTDSR